MGVARGAALLLTVLAGLYIGFDADGLFRVPTVLAFAFLAPGLAWVRRIRGLGGVDTVALVGVISVVVVLLSAMAMVIIDQWTPFAAYLCVAVVTLLGVASGDADE